MPEKNPDDILSITRSSTLAAMHNLAYIEATFGLEHLAIDLFNKSLNLCKEQGPTICNEEQILSTMRSLKL